MDRAGEHDAGAAAEVGTQGEFSPMNAAAAAERWHELLTSRFVCEACLTRYFMKYRRCKACGEIGRVRSLTASLFDLADDDGELRDMIANGQRFGAGESINPET
jgi:hypothetical protein